MYYSPIGESYDRDRVADYRRHLTKTYALMALGLAVTFGAAIVTALFLPHLFVFNFYVSIALLVAEVVTVIAFSAMLSRAKVGTLVEKKYIAIRVPTFARGSIALNAMTVTTSATRSTTET